MGTEAVLPPRPGGGVERFAGVVRDGVVGRPAVANLVREGREAVGERAGRSPRDERRHRRVVSARPGQRGPVRIIGGGLRTGDERGAELRRHRAQVEHGGDAGAVHDASRRDDRQAGAADQQPGQRHRAERVVGCGGVEHAAMAARFDALRHDHVDPGRFDRARFTEAGGGREQEDAAFAQRRQGVRRRQAEVEADDGRRGFHQHRQHVRILGEAPVDRAKRLGRLGAELGEQRAQPVEPFGLADRVSRRRPMREQVDVEGPVGALAQRRDHRARADRVGGAHPDRAEAAVVGHGRRQCRRGHPGHRGLDYGNGQAELIETRHKRPAHPRSEHQVRL